MSKSLHDKKPWYKPPKWFKRMQKRIRRAKNLKEKENQMYGIGISGGMESSLVVPGEMVRVLINLSWIGISLNLKGRFLNYLRTWSSGWSLVGRIDSRRLISVSVKEYMGKETTPCLLKL